MIIYTVNTSILPDKLAKVQSDWTVSASHSKWSKFQQKIPIWIHAVAAIVNYKLTVASCCSSRLLSPAEDTDWSGLTLTRLKPTLTGAVQNGLGRI